MAKSPDEDGFLSAGAFFERDDMQLSVWGGEERDPLLDAPRMYGLTQHHKHLPEMQKYCGLENAPAFSPVVAPYYAGMEVTVPLFLSQING
ncbi:MAG: hypothetical protein IKX78_02985, partial [Clostridia bacterium]|nr:hypothetical protein [Clostridia bacterium]